MPIPEPQKGQQKQEYIGECISFLIKEGRPKDQAAAICYSKWEKFNEDNDMSIIEKIDMYIEEEETKFLTKKQREKLPKRLKKAIINHKKKKLNNISEQLNIKDFNNISLSFDQKDDFGVEAAASLLKDKAKEEMNLLSKITPTANLKNVENIYNKFYIPFNKAIEDLEENPLNKNKYNKAAKAFEILIKKIKNIL